MRRVRVLLVLVLATFAPVALPPAWGCTVGGSFWHLPASQAGGYLALDGGVVTLLRADTGELLEQRLTGAEGRFSFDVAVAGDVLVAVSGFATLQGGLYFFGDPPRGFGDGTRVVSCAGGNIEFGPLHVLQGMAAPAALPRRRPRASVRPSRARSGAHFRLKVRRFDPGERLVAVEERPDQTVHAGTLDVDPQGVGRVRVVGRQLVGRHRWCFRGETSHREACVVYRVRPR